MKYGHFIFAVDRDSCEIKKMKRPVVLITLFMMKKKKVDSPGLERMNENVVKWRNRIYRNL